MSLFLYDPDLEYMRAQVAQMLPGTAIIQRKATANDGAGGFTETWSAVTGGTVACRVDFVLNRGRAQVLTAGRAEALEYKYSVTMPYDAPAGIGDRLSIAGTVYEIGQLANAHSWNVSIRALVNLVE